MLLDIIENELSRIGVLQLLFRHTHMIEQLLPLWRDVAGIEALRWIPADVRQVLEVRWARNVQLSQPEPFAFLALLLVVLCALLLWHGRFRS